MVEEHKYISYNDFLKLPVEHYEDIDVTFDSVGDDIMLSYQKECDTWYYNIYVKPGKFKQARFKGLETIKDILKLHYDIAGGISDPSDPSDPPELPFKISIAVKKDGILIRNLEEILSKEKDSQPKDLENLAMLKLNKIYAQTERILKKLGIED